MRFEKSQWCDDAARGLQGTFDDIGPDALQEWISSGRCELWRIDGHSWLITQAHGEILFVWCYKGRNARQLVESLLRIARHNGKTVVQFPTYRAAFLKMLERFDAQLVERGENGLLIVEMQT